MLKGKTVVLAVTGSIAAYKIANLASMLVRQHAAVHVLMTEHATNFIHPLTFETLTQHKCLIDTFDRNFQYSVEHVAIAKQADAVMVAPASANVIGKLANGLADDMLTTTIMACPCPKLIAPAMNHNMYHNPIVQANIERLRSFGYEIVPPDTGRLANGDTGDGRMPDESLLLAHLLRTLHTPKDLAGKRLLITAGATQEPIDPVRFLTNHSTGKMGFALAKAAMHRGAEVTVVAGHTEAAPPPFVEVIRVGSAQEMFETVTALAPQADIIIKAAAVADYTPVSTCTQKLKKTGEDLTLVLKRTPDILQYLGAHKREGQFLCGFSMETEDLLDHSRQKLAAKHADMICANSLCTEGAGFGTDTNVLTLLTAAGEETLPMMSKEAAAHRILDAILQRMAQK